MALTVHPLLRQMNVKELLTILAVSSVLIAGQSPSPGSIQSIPGAIKEYKGTVFPISSFVDIKLNLLPLHDFKAELSKMAHSIDLLIDKIFSYTGPTDLFQLLSPALHRLKFKLASYTDITYNPVNGSRSRRGLFDFVGVLSNELFGIVDTKSLEHRLQEYNNRQTSVAKTINANTRAISTLNHNVNQLKEATEQLSEVVTARLNSADKFAEMAFVINQYEVTFMQISSAAERFQNAVLRAAQGIVTKNLISPRDIRKTIHNLKSSHDLQPLFKQHEYMLLYSCLSSYLTKEGISILLPLRPPTTLRGYVIHPFPLQVNSSDMYVTLNAPYVILAPEPKQVITQTQAIALPTQSLYDTCHAPSLGIYVCMAPLWPYYTNVSSCEHAIVSHPHNIHSGCSFSKLLPAHTPFTVATQLQTIFYFYNDTQATISCGNNITRSKLNGPFVLPHSCSLKCISFSFPAIKHFQTTLNHDLQFPTPVTLPPPHNILPKSFDPKLTTVELPPPLSPPIHHHQIFAYGYPIAMSLGVIVVVGSVLFMAACCARRHNISKYKY